MIILTFYGDNMQGEDPVYEMTKLTQIICWTETGLWRIERRTTSLGL